MIVPALAVERQTCDSCHAAPGLPCMTGNGTARTIPHEPRIAVAMIPRDVRSVDCEQCGADAGMRCISKGHRFCEHHAIRKRKAMFGKQIDMRGES